MTVQFLYHHGKKFFGYIYLWIRALAFFANAESGVFEGVKKAAHLCIETASACACRRDSETRIGQKIAVR